MIRYPDIRTKWFNTPKENHDLFKFMESHQDASESIFNQIMELFPQYNEKHPEHPYEVNLHTFLLGLADLILESKQMDEEEG